MSDKVIDSTNTLTQPKTDDKLGNIHIENDSVSFSKETFDVIYDLLLERGETNLPQTKQVETTKAEGNTLSLEGFFNFQFFISTHLIQIFYLIGAVTITTVSWTLFFKSHLLIGLTSIILGNLFWRFSCEMAIIFFRINEHLGIIHRELKQRGFNSKSLS